MRTTSPIKSLSDEILVEILQHVQNCSTAGALLSSLLTCRQWHRIGTPISHRDILIRNRDLTTSIGPLSAHSDEVHSLTVRLQPCQVDMYTPEGQASYIKVPVEDLYQLRTQGSRATQALWKDMESFATLICTMCNLTTFSLILEPTPGEAAKHGFWIHLRCLLTLLEALPKSVSNLELDLGLLDAARDGGPRHVCHALSRLLPQLRHLRLRLGTLCAALFDLGEEASTAPHLETLVINTSMGGRKTCGCVVLDDYTPDARRVHIMDNSGQVDYWPSVCLSALESGIFPNIKRFEVFAFEPNDSWPSMENDGGEGEGHEDDEDDEDDSIDSDALRADHWNQHDILTQKTYNLPLRRVAQDKRSLMLRTRLHEEVFGDVYTTEQKAEGPAWVGTVGGLRFPAPFAASKEAVSRGYVWGDLGLEDREGFCRRSRFGLEIWAKEKRDNRWILTVGEVDRL